MPKYVNEEPQCPYYWAQREAEFYREQHGYYPDAPTDNKTDAI